MHEAQHGPTNGITTGLNRVIHKVSRRSSRKTAARRVCNPGASRRDRLLLDVLALGKDVLLPRLVLEVAERQELGLVGLMTESVGTLRM